MANEKNLIPFSERTEEEQRAIRSKGGRASGKSRREQKTFGQIASRLLDMALRDAGEVADIEKDESLQKIAGKNVSVKVALMLALIKKGLDGDINAIEKLICLIGDRTDNRRSRKLDEQLVEWKKNQIKAAVEAMTKQESDAEEAQSSVQIYLPEKDVEVEE